MYKFVWQGQNTGIKYKVLEDANKKEDWIYLI